MSSIFEVIVVGGSAAGLSAALVLGRSLRRVLVIDSGRPCNRQTPHSHGFFTRDGATPAELLAAAQAQLGAYPSVARWDGQVVRAQAQADGFEVELADGRHVRARRLVLATGLADQLPAIPGFAECWGISVLHCPYCHGYEVHGQPLGVFGNGEAGFELAKLILAWSPNLHLFTHGPSTLTPDQARQLAAHRVPVTETPVAAFEHQAGALQHVRLADGTAVPLPAVFARVPFVQHSDLAAQLGCALAANGLVQVDEFGQTTVPGVFAAGDNSSLLRQVGAASASGAKAAAWLNRGFIEEAFAA